MKKDISILLRLFKMTASISRCYLVQVLTLALLRAIQPFLGLIIPMLLINELLGELRVEVLGGLVMALALGNLLLNTLIQLLEYRVLIESERVYQGFDQRLGRLVVSMSYEHTEDPYMLDLKEQAIFPLKNQGVIYNILTNSVNIVQYVIFCIGATGIVATLHPLIPLIIMGIVCFNAYKYQGFQKTLFEFYQKLIPVNRKFSYFAQLTSDFSLAKDVRLYKLNHLIMKRVHEFNDESYGWFTKINIKIGKFGVFSTLMSQLQLLLVYSYVVYQVTLKVIGIGELTLYVNTTAQFAKSLSLLINNIVEISQYCRYFERYLEFEDAITQNDSHVLADVPQDIKSIEFRNVSFKYPRSEQYVLQNINLSVKKGDHVSIVGLNGAGKTTLIKLLMRLYEPSSGEILLNGIPISQFEVGAYQSLFGVVFQDFKTFAFSVLENVSFGEAVDEEMIDELLMQVGLQSEVEKLPQGIQTSLYKTFDEAGVEFSGGMAQKLAIARALHKQASMMILDEPTAALDPVAEAEIFELFHEMVQEKTTLYISHRLSSCRLSDYIVVFADKEIAEIGSHEELMKQAGIYAELFNMQARYYQNDVA